MPYVKPEYDYLMKILLIGDSGVGKSSLVKSFTDENFRGDYSATIALDLKIKTIMLGGAVAKLQIWDTAGSERFRTLTSHFYRGADGAIITYDCTNKESFANVNFWINEIQRYSNNDKIQLLLVGNKCDLIDEKVITKEIAEQYADQAKIPIFETSAKDMINVHDAFVSMAARIKELIKPAGTVLTETYPSFILDENGQNVNNDRYWNCCGY